MSNVIITVKDVKKGDYDGVYFDVDIIDDEEGSMAVKVAGAIAAYVRDVLLTQDEFLINSTETEH